MINAVDEALRRLLVRELPIKNSEVEIKFDQPGREWAARLNRPTLNLFLYDVRENQKLRQTQPLWDVEHKPDGSVSRRRKPVRVDLHYMITAWANDPEDEHRLLGRALMALFRFADLPEEVLPEGLRNQPKPIPIMVAQYEELRNPTEVWQVLDNEMRPGVACVLTLALDPYQPLTTPLVRTRELVLGPSPLPPAQQLAGGVEPGRFWTVGGILRSKTPLEPEQVQLTLVERGQEVRLGAGSRFTIGRLRAGEYTLEVVVDGGKPQRHTITVPAPDYEIEV
jgi:hypothetical protein